MRTKFRNEEFGCIAQLQRSTVMVGAKAGELLHRLRNFDITLAEAALLTGAEIDEVKTVLLRMTHKGMVSFK